MAAFKAQAMMRALQENLKLAEPTASFAQSNDSSFFPTMLISVGSAGTYEAILIKIEMLPDAAQHVDALGSPQRLYNPHRINILREDAGGSTAIRQAELRERVTAECIKMGSRVDIWEKDGIALTTDPSTYSLSGATEVADLSVDLRKANPMTNSQ